jgi:hypothetical protein
VPLSAAAKVDSAISQGFIAKQNLPVGAVVSFTADVKDGTVEAGHTDNATRLVGVITKTALIELSGGASEVQVATSGSSFALISDINGEVKRGDKIAASPVAGIGMKATESTQVLGTAEENFSAAQQVSERKVTTTTGESRTIKVGLLTTQVNVAYYQKPDESDSILPAFLLRFASNLVGRDVAPLRVLIALVLLSAGFGGVAVLLYSSVRSSIISIGRNPLSADAVHKGVFEIAGIAFGVLLLTLIAVYLVLVI